MRDQSGLESGVWCGETRGNRRDQSGPHSKGDKAGCRIPGQLQRFIVAHTLHEMPCGKITAESVRATTVYRRSYSPRESNECYARQRHLFSGYAF